MNILAIEISTSSAKALLYSSEKGVRAVESMPFPVDSCDIMSQEPEGIYNALKKCILKIVNRLQEPVDAVGISTTWHSILFLDKKHMPLGRIYTWAHNRAGMAAERYREDSDFKRWYYNRTGCMVHSTYPLWQYIYFRDTHSLVYSEKPYISSQQTFIFEKLTGEFAVSKTTASGSGFLSIHKLTWDEDLLDFAGISEEQLPALKDPFYAAPLKEEAAEELGLPPGIPVVIGGADGAMNQIGDGAVRNGFMTFSVGTSGAVRMVTEKPLLPEQPSTWCYYLGEGMWIAGAATAGACNCIEWFIKSYSATGKLSYDDLEKRLYSVERDGAPIFLPFLYGERCPGWRDNRSGGFFHLSARHGLEDMYYAILEGVLFNLYHCYRILTREMGKPSRIIISGGIEHSPEWLQMAADIFQTELAVSQVQHASLLGTAILTLKALGRISELQDHRPDPQKIIFPDKVKKDLYHRRFEKYLEIYNKF
ncbi:MAG TPA: gluconokinase [Thermoanaerobacterales bacterium]|nr:gluconokinase [Thermoanaerobacterales bacterium]